MNYRGARRQDLQRILPLAEAFARERSATEGQTLAENFMAHVEPGMDAALENPAAFVVVAETGDQLVGYATVFVQEPPPVFASTPYLFASDLYVSPHFRGQGVGTALLERARGWGLIKGVTRMSMVVPLSQPAALRAAAKAGFRPLEQLLFWEG